MLEKFIYLIIILLPSYLIRFKILGVPFTLLEILILGLFILFLLEKRFKVYLGRWKYGLALWVMISMVAVIWSPDKIAALGVWKAYLIEPMLFFIVFINVKPALKKILIALGILAIFLGLIAIIQHLTGYGIPAPWNIRGSEFRVTAIYDYPNALGLILAPIISLFYGYLFFAKEKKIFSLSVIIISLFAIFASQTQGALLAILGSLFFLTLFSKYRIHALVIFSIGLLLIFSFPPLKEVVSFQDVSGQVRLALWKGTAELLKAQPLQGAGLAAFSRVYNQYRLPSHVELLLYPHNLFLDFWAELGIFGLGWLVGILIWFFWTGLKKKNYLVMAAMVAIVLYGLVDSPYFKNDLSIFFWLTLALMENKNKIPH